MCTALSFTAKDHYFGRNLDLEFSYNEEIVITPRNFPFDFKHLPSSKEHLAMIGVAAISKGYPLYFDATNEKGLSMAGLNFPDNAVYRAIMDDMNNVAPFELIPWILSQCETVKQAKILLEKLNLINLPFSPAYPLTPLHFMLCDRVESIVIEPMHDKIYVYENKTKVLTNNPPFPMQLQNLNNYMHLTCNPPANKFSKELDLKPYSRGMGGLGLPGDLSSASRFVKAVFVSQSALHEKTESSNVGQFFHILKSVEQTKGCVILEGGEAEFTAYSSCCNTDKGIFYYTTYQNSQISSVRLYNENLDTEKLISYPMISEQQIYKHN